MEGGKYFEYPLAFILVFRYFTGSQQTIKQMTEKKSKIPKKTVHPFVYQDRAGASLLPDGNRHSPAKPLPMDAKMRPTPDRTATIRLTSTGTAS